MGTNFAKAFNIQYAAESGELKLCHTASWGMSSRMIGGVIMTHGDDKGLILPPLLAPYQVVIVPIGRGEQAEQVLPAARELAARLHDAGIRTHVDDRLQLSPGFKFNDWEMRGVPLRIEVGPRDVQKGTVALARRDRPGREGRSFVPQAGLADVVVETLRDIHASLLDRALAFRKANTHEPKDYGKFKEVVEKGWAHVWWAGDREDEARIKEETKATIRCIPLEQPPGSGPCFYTGRPARQQVIFARAY